MQATNLRTLSTIIAIAGWTVCALSLIAALGQATWLIAYSQFMESGVMLIVAGLASTVNWLVFLASIIPVLIWTHTAHSNLRKAGLSGLKHSPAWATFSFLVPVANLFVPFGAMRELANRSAGEPEELADASVDEVTSWWGCWIGSLVFSSVLGVVVLIELVPGLFVTTPFWAHQVLLILSLVLNAGSAFFLVKMVKMISRNQEAGASMLAAFE